ncbi:MAG: hypothetical protein P0Y55_18010 [Candidatus Cohnella colombiensis]|uniref:DUF4309 domain-containing protein n=1 Tax=Candidatus Cohnella colombiensis TaxID=3121368 RepID=A0AA95EWI3_9BACL|nr:MAG: hypothetical protein P0Y55_18010 [Cohnella sp.]
MRKMLLLIICTLSLTACFGGEGAEVQTAQPTVKSIEVDQPEESALPQSSISNYEDLESSLTTVDTENAITTDFYTLKEIMGLNKEKVIEKLGQSYSQYVGSDLQPGKGLLYEEMGLSIIFDEKTGSIKTIYCNELVDIDGVKLGMEPNEISLLLGSGKTKITTGRKPSYEMSYNFGQFFIRFIATDENSPITRLEIQRNDAYEDSITSRASFKPDLEHIQAIINMDRESIIELLGMDYYLYYSNGDTHYGTGIAYPQWGITITFDNSGDYIDSILCDEGATYEGITNVDINGAKVGMTVSELREILGEGEIVDWTLDPEWYPPNYLLVYEFDKIVVSFWLEDREGKTDDLHIYRKAGEIFYYPDSNQVKPIAYALDFNKIKKLISLTQEQVIEELGKEYGEYHKVIGKFELGYGLFYERYGMIFVNEYYSNINSIYCRENVDINGAKLGMTFSEIQRFLGTEGVVERVEPESMYDQPYYKLIYTYDDFTICFAAYEKGGRTVEAKIQSIEAEELDVEVH